MNFLKTIKVESANDAELFASVVEMTKTLKVAGVNEK